MTNIKITGRLDLEKTPEQVLKFIILEQQKKIDKYEHVWVPSKECKPLDISVMDLMSLDVTKVKKYLETISADDFDLRKLISDVKLVAEKYHTDDNGSDDRDEEGIAWGRALYAYEEYYIVYKYFQEGELWSLGRIEDEDPEEFFRKTCFVYSNKDFDVSVFLEDKDDIETLMDVFHNMNPDTGFYDLVQYLGHRYRKQFEDGKFSL